MPQTAEGTRDSRRRSRACLDAMIASRISTLVFSIACLALGSAVAAQEDAVEVEAGHYTSREPGDFGIGKIYMGREIGVVMSPEGASWLDRGERAREERPDLVLEAMEIETDWVVADIGAASGYYSFRLSSRVPEGRVLAVDIQPELLQLIEERSALAGVDNVEAVLGTIEDPGLPESAADAVLLVAAALDDELLSGFREVAAAASLAALVEVHNEVEAERALEAGASMVGVNNRDLHSFVTDLGVAERLAPLLEGVEVRVAESGVTTPEDAGRMEAAGYDAVLVGSALVQSPDPASLIRSLQSR